MKRALRSKIVWGIIFTAALSCQLFIGLNTLSAQEHPRLFFTSGDIQNIRNKALVERRDIWEQIKVSADQIVKDTNGDKQMPIFPPQSTGAVQKYDTKLETLALAYLVSGDAKYLDAAKKWLTRICAYDKWSYVNGDYYVDLAGSHLIFGVSIAYDWLYNDLSDPERKMVEDRLITEVRSRVPESQFEMNRYWNNHYWLWHASVGMAGLALKDKIPVEAAAWIEQARSVSNRILANLPPDGSWHEGIVYSWYGTKYLLQFMDALKNTEQADLFTDNPWLKNYPYYILYTLYPDMKYSNGIGDGGEGFEIPGSILSKLAAEYDQPHAQWLADSVKPDLISPWYRDGSADTPGFYFDMSLDDTYAKEGNYSLRIKSNFNGNALLTDYIPIDITKGYEFSCFAKAGTAGTTQKVTLNYIEYDANQTYLRHSSRQFEIGSAWTQISLIIPATSFHPNTKHTRLRLFPNFFNGSLGSSQVNQAWFDQIRFHSNDEPRKDLIKVKYFEGLARVDKAYYDHWDLLWSDAAIPSLAPKAANLPLYRYFDDLGLVIMRSSWDSNANYLSFISGPAGGHKAAKIADENGEAFYHSHPQQNSFIYYADQRLFLVDEGYSYKKKTSFHNTVTINDKGQLGEWPDEWWQEAQDSNGWQKPDKNSLGYYNWEYLWMRKVPYANSAFIRHFEAKPDYIYVVGDASKNYNASVKLKKFLRHIVYLGDYFVVMDELESEDDVNYHWLLHAPSVNDTISMGQSLIDINVQGKHLKAEMLEPLSPTNSVGKTTVPRVWNDAQPGGAILDRASGDYLDLGSTGKTTRFLAVFYPEDKKPDIRELEDGIQINNKVFIFNPFTLITLVQPNGAETLTCGAGYDIEWSAFGGQIHHLELFYSTDGGKTYPYLIADNIPNQGKYTWSVPNITSDQVRVKIIVKNSAGKILVEGKGDNFSIIPSVPNIGSILPNSGKSAPGVPAIFTTTYIDSNGWQDIDRCLFLIDTSTDGKDCFYGYYDKNKNLLFLRNDAQTNWLGAFAPGTNYIIENTYAKLDCAKTSVSGSGNTLTIKWNITFKAPFIGTQAKNMYLYVRDGSGKSSNWVQKGSWVVGGDLLPEVGVINPSSGSTPINAPAIFTTTYIDSNGWQDIDRCLFLIDTSTDGKDCFYGYYDKNKNLLFLRNDAQTNWLGAFAPGTNYIIENTYAKLDCAKTSVSGSGNTLTIKWNITFKAPFIGTQAKNMYLYVRDGSGKSSNWVQKGSWVVEP